MNQANGRPMNGRPRSPPRTVEEKDAEGTDENIFLFVPNLIGMRQQRGDLHLVPY